MKTVTEFIFLGSKITVDGDCSHEIKRCLLLRRKVMMNLDSILKSRDTTLPIKVYLQRWLQRTCMLSRFNRVWFLRPYGLWSARLLCSWDSPGKNIGLGCHSLLQRIFGTQGLNPGLPGGRQILYHPEPQDFHSSLIDQYYPVSN